MQEKYLLFHGSKDGLTGDPMPISREDCDFGAGFYLGTIYDQAVGITERGHNRWLYTYELDLSELNPDTYIWLNEKQWLYTFIAHRIQIYKNLKLFIDIRSFLLRYDFVIGQIADDRMIGIMNGFRKNIYTTETVFYATRAIDLGMQFVAKTCTGCYTLKYVKSEKIPLDMLNRVISERKDTLKEFSRTFKKIVAEHNKNGLLLSELCQQVEENRITIDSIFRSAGRKS